MNVSLVTCHRSVGFSGYTDFLLSTKATFDVAIAADTVAMLQLLLAIRTPLTK